MQIRCPYCASQLEAESLEKNVGWTFMICKHCKMGMRLSHEDDGYKLYYVTEKGEQTMFIDEVPIIDDADGVTYVETLNSIIDQLSDVEKGLQQSLDAERMANPDNPEYWGRTDRSATTDILTPIVRTKTPHITGSIEKQKETERLMREKKIQEEQIALELEKEKEREREYLRLKNRDAGVEGEPESEAEKDKPEIDVVSLGAMQQMEEIERKPTKSPRDNKKIYKGDAFVSDHPPVSEDHIELIEKSGKSKADMEDGRSAKIRIEGNYTPGESVENAENIIKRTTIIHTGRLAPIGKLRKKINFANVKFVMIIIAIFAVVGLLTVSALYFTKILHRKSTMPPIDKYPEYAVLIDSLKDKYLTEPDDLTKFLADARADVLSDSKEKIKRGIAAYENALLFHPQNADVVAGYVFSQLYRNYSSVDSLKEKQLEQALEFADDQKGAKQTLINRSMGFLQYWLGYANEAKALIDTSCGTQPLADDIECKLLGAMVFKRDDPNLAVKLLMQAKKLPQVHSQVYYLMGDALKIMGHYAEAENAYLAAAKLGGEEKAVYLHLGRLYVDVGDLDSALKAFETAVEDEEVRAQAAIGAALMARQNNYKLREALSLVDTAIDKGLGAELPALRSRVFTEQAMLYFALKKYPQGIDAINRGKLHEKDDPTRTLLSYASGIMSVSGSEALKSLYDAVEAYNDRGKCDFTCRFLYAYALYDAGETKQALTHFRDLLKEDKTFTPAHIAVASLNFDGMNQREAMAALSNLYSFSPFEVLTKPSKSELTIPKKVWEKFDAATLSADGPGINPILLKLYSGMAAFQLGRYDASLEIMKSLRQMNNSDPKLNALTGVYISSALIMTGAYREAVNFLDGELRRAPSPDFMLIQGIAYDKMGNNDRALALFKTAYDKAADSKLAFVHYAKAQLKKGDAPQNFEKKLSDCESETKDTLAYKNAVFLLQKQKNEGR